MGKVIDFFNRGGGASTPPTDIDALLRRVRPHSRAALRLRKSANPTSIYFGGSPMLPTNIEWPQKNNKPLTFLASINLAEVARLGVIAWLPDVGHLLFFYDIDEQAWGFDPKDRGSWAVIHVPGPSEERVQKEPLDKQYYDLQPLDSMPDWERFEKLGISFSDQEVDAYIDCLIDLDEVEEEHQMSGYPQTIQGDAMELECQLVSNGINIGDAGGEDSPKANLLQAGEKDWRLLLQHSGDDESGLMWGDCGRIYFWVKEDDARRGDFSNVWLVLQCS